MMELTGRFLLVLIVFSFSLSSSALYALTGTIVEKSYYERYMKLSNGKTFGPFVYVSKFFTDSKQKKWAFVYKKSRTDRNVYIKTFEGEELGPFYSVLYGNMNRTDKGCLFIYSLLKGRKRQWYIHFQNKKTVGPFFNAPVLKYDKKNNFWIYSCEKINEGKPAYHVKVKGKPLFGPFDRVRSPVLTKDGSQWAFTYEKNEKMYVHFSNGRILGPYRHIFGPSFSDNGKLWVIKFITWKSVVSAPVSLLFSDGKIFSSGRYYGIKWPNFSDDNRRYGFAGRTYGGWDVVFSTGEKFGVFSYAYPPFFGPGKLWAFVYRRNNMYYIRFSSGKTIGPYKAACQIIFQKDSKTVDLQFKKYQKGKIVKVYERIRIP